MKKIFNSDSLTILLLIVATSCIARNVRNRSNNNEHFRYSMKKYSTIKINYTDVADFVDVCPNHINGILYTFLADVPVKETVFDGNINASNIVACYLHNYVANVTTDTEPGGSTLNGTVDIDLYFCGEKFHFNATFCSDGYCDNLAGNGTYINETISSTCSRFWFGFDG